MPRARILPKKLPVVHQSGPTASPFNYQSPPKTAPRPPIDTKAKLEARVNRHQINALIVAGLALGGITFYSVSLYISTTKRSTFTAPGPLTQSELTAIYDHTAKSFDADVGLSERLMGMIGVRKKLIGQCRGDVLEVSAGTARNLGYYRFQGEGRGMVQDGVTSLTLVDLSQEMVDVAQRKWTVFRATAEGKSIKEIEVRFLNGDAAGKMPEPPAHTASSAVSREGGKKGYDTIVQTMGLCSTDSPVELLQNLSSYLNRSNPDAKILLLEHGQSYYEWLNNILDNQAPAHATQHGCWWNRDIGEIVQKSGLEVIRERRRNLGTTWIYELKPGKLELERQVSTSKSIQTEDSTKVDSQEASGLAAWLPRWTYEKICKR